MIDRTQTKPAFTSLVAGAFALFCLSAAPLTLAADQQAAGRTVHTSPTGQLKTFDTPQAAGDALVAAADTFNIGELEKLFGTAGKDVVLSGEYARDRARARQFVAEAREKTATAIDPNNATRAFLLVGNESWPFPVPIVKRGGRWSFDVSAGRQEIVYRRIGANELDAIEVCRRYVDAQHEYALQKRDGYDVNQYAQRIISTPGQKDGLAWQNADGTWSGPIGDEVARAIEQGYTSRAEPFHGYFFKVLKGQGPAAPLGQMDFVVEGAMIGGFALAAAPAEYGLTGIQTFIVSHDGVVYQKDLGPATLDQFAKMDRFNPDASWRPVPEE